MRLMSTSSQYIVETFPSRILPGISMSIHPGITTRISLGIPGIPPNNPSMNSSLPRFFKKSTSEILPEVPTAIPPGITPRIPSVIPSGIYQACFRGFSC